MGVPALLRLSDSGVRLDPGLHEITHVIQQAQGVAQAGGRWERRATDAAEAVTAGRVYPDLSLEPPRARHGAAVLAGFNSWEHRLLGDVPGDVLVGIAARTQNWQSLVRQQVTLMGLWQDGGEGVGVAAIHEIDPGVTVVTLPGSAAWPPSASSTRSPTTPPTSTPSPRCPRHSCTRSCSRFARRATTVSAGCSGTRRTSASPARSPVTWAPAPRLRPGSSRLSHGRSA